MDHVIHADQFDKQIWLDTAAEFESVLYLKEQGHKLVNNKFPFLVDDIFQSLYKYNPVFEEKIDEHLVRNRTFLEEMVGSDDYKALREYVKLDETASAMATLNLTQKLIERLQKDENFREQMKKQPKQEQKEQQPGQPQPAKTEEEKAVEEQAAQKANAQQRKLIAQVLRAAVKQTQQQIETETEMCQAYGMEPGELKQLKFEDRLNFIKRIQNNKQLNNLAARIGRLSRLLKSAKMQKTKYGRQEIVGIHTSNDVARQTPREMLMMKKAPLDWKHRFATRQLQTYQMQGYEPKSKGPVVICIDKSGSMAGDKDNWATAIMFSVMMECKKDKRTLSVCFFGERVMQTKTLEGGKYDINDLMALCSVAANDSGTNFEPPFEYAMEQIKADAKLRQADILFITDGIGPLDDEYKVALNNQRKTQEVNVFTILIGMLVKNAEHHNLKKVSDEMHDLDGILSETSVAGAFNSMANNTNI